MNNIFLYEIPDEDNEEHICKVCKVCYARILLEVFTDITEDFRNYHSKAIVERERNGHSNN